MGHLHNYMFRVMISALIHSFSKINVHNQNIWEYIYYDDNMTADECYDTLESGNMWPL